MIPLPNKCSCCETDTTFGGLLGQRRFLFDLHHPASVTQIQSYLLMSSKQYWYPAENFFNLHDFVNFVLFGQLVVFTVR